LGIKIIQSDQVRISPEDCLAVLVIFRNKKPFWIHKVMIKYDMTVSKCNPSY
jgi:hypothetical protein